MRQAWIHLECPGCQTVWESTLEALDSRDEDFECPYCGETNPVVEFVKTKEGLQILEEFRESG